MDELGLKVKRNRTDLTLDIKRKTIQFHKQNPNFNQLNFALHFSKKYGVKLVSDIFIIPTLNCRTKWVGLSRDTYLNY
ncbi:hypothetical protein BpHYR1_043193 [Brachionus plicatilis]|uniref:Uncharacterized protein n=1 Tax=Brachionus plicatilis TaxID=10195 RepID=A0A3M7Q8W3_BRAPC|nr:hypothetical protein BpHYR1_043193 [Brachionus plicatilis]